jgi:hypothetical protein
LNKGEEMRSNFSNFGGLKDGSIVNSYSPLNKNNPQLVGPTNIPVQSNMPITPKDNPKLFELSGISKAEPGKKRVFRRPKDDATTTQPVIQPGITSFDYNVPKIIETNNQNSILKKNNSINNLSLLKEENENSPETEKIRGELKEYILRKKNNIFSRAGSPLDYSFLQILLSAWCPYKCLDQKGNQRNLTFELAIKVVRENLDAVNLIKMTREIDFLKHGLLKDRQLSFINYLGKHKFQFPYDINEGNEIDKEIRGLLNIQTYFNEIKYKVNNRKIDKNIIDFIDPELVKIFEKY